MEVAESSYMLGQVCNREFILIFEGCFIPFHPVLPSLFPSIFHFFPFASQSIPLKSS